MQIVDVTIRCSGTAHPGSSSEVVKSDRGSPAGAGADEDDLCPWSEQELALRVEAALTVALLNIFNYITVERIVISTWSGLD
jgi:hypothetical protein